MDWSYFPGQSNVTGQQTPRGRRISRETASPRCLDGVVSNPRKFQLFQERAPGSADKISLSSLKLQARGRHLS